MTHRMALIKTSPLFHLFCKTPSALSSYTGPNCFKSLKPIMIHPKFQPKNTFSMTKTTNLCTTSAILQGPSSSSSAVPHKSRKKARSESPEILLRFKLDQCSKRGDLGEALRIYDEARADNVPLSVHHYNVLLYLCSARSNSSDDISLEKGFQIFKQMGLDNVVPNEATFTSAARLAAAKEDPEMAFDLVKKMESYGIVPKLRSYGPALFGFCKKSMADKAFEVDAHMVENGVLAEEEELLTLLRLSSEENLVEKTYEFMHRMRSTVRQVSEETAGAMEDWFKSETAADAGLKNWDVEKVKEGIVKGGGGWHGQGWLGKGKWSVVRTEMQENGVCHSCGEKLVCIDIDPKETENFANSVAKLACEREVRADFVKFQEWLAKHGPFDAVIDGANLGLINQKHFSFQQKPRVWWSCSVP